MWFSLAVLWKWVQGLEILAQKWVSWAHGGLVVEAEALFVEVEPAIEK